MEANFELFEQDILDCTLEYKPFWMVFLTVYFGGKKVRFHLFWFYFIIGQYSSSVKQVEIVHNTVKAQYY